MIGSPPSPALSLSRARSLFLSIDTRVRAHTRTHTCSCDASETWLAGLGAAVAAAPAPPLLLCHSLGCVLAAHYLAGGDVAKDSIAGAFLVAPGDVDWMLDQQFPLPSEALACLKTFAPLPRQPLGVPAVVVASASDHFAPIEVTEKLARDWGVALVTAEAGGHINAESGHGPWPEGQGLLAGLAHRIANRI